MNKETKIKQLMAHMSKLLEERTKISELWAELSDDHIVDSVLALGYPYSKSFDEGTADVKMWVISVNEALWAYLISGGLVDYQTQKENNKLIAEFIGYRPSMNPDFVIASDDFLHTEEEHIPVADLKFHSSWDWLMPVVEKIEADRCKFQIEKNYCKIWAIGTFTGKTTIEATYKAVVEFIKWYNEKIKS